MAERVCCRDDEVDEVLRDRARDWVLVAVVPDIVVAGGRHFQLRELYFERRRPEERSDG